MHDDLKAKLRKLEPSFQYIEMLSARARDGLESGRPLPPEAGRSAGEQAEYLRENWPPAPHEADIIGAIHNACPHIPIDAQVFSAICGMY